MKVNMLKVLFSPTAEFSLSYFNMLRLKLGYFYTTKLLDPKNIIKLEIDLEKFKLPITVNL